MAMDPRMMAMMAGQGTQPATAGQPTGPAAMPMPVPPPHPTKKSKKKGVRGMDKRRKGRHGRKR